MKFPVEGKGTKVSRVKEVLSNQGKKRGREGPKLRKREGTENTEESYSVTPKKSFGVAHQGGKE